MRTYAAEQVSALLRRLVFRVKRAAKLPDADSIHDLRVAIRRFSQCLRVFRRFFPANEVKKLRRRLRKIMGFTAKVRDRDIALQLCAQAGLQSGSSLVRRLVEERKQAEAELLDRLEQLARRDFSRDWRERLGL
jgi:CHAD domain-containing protein